MKKAYSTYIFDIDGTLIHTAPRILSSIQESLDAVGVQYEQSQITDTLIGPKIADILDVMGLESSEELKMEVVQNFRRIYDSDPISQSVMYEEVAPILEMVKTTGCRLFVATNKPKMPTEKILSTFGLDFFEDVYCPNKYDGKELSKAEMLAEIIQNNKLNPQDVLMIGDTEGDYKATQQVGCDFGFASWGYAKDKQRLKKVSQVVFETTPVVQKFFKQNLGGTYD